MKRRLLFLIVSIAVLAIALLWVTRERPRLPDGDQEKGHRATVGSRELTMERSSDFPVVASPVARTTGSSKARVMPVGEDGGERAQAVVRVGSRQMSFQPNSLGLFPRVTIGLKESVRVAVNYPDAQPGDLVVIQSEDGGTLDGGQFVSRATLDDARQVQFTFTSTEEGGLYRVCLRKGFNEKRLEFWGGTQTASR